MKFAAVLAGTTALLSPTATALSLFDLKGSQVTISDDDNKIPGESPLELCDGDHSDDLIVIRNVDLSPNPPKAGKELLITASGTIKETISDGAYVKISVKYGLIKLLTTTASLCEQIANVDLECPLEPGDKDIVKTVDLPAEIPPGKYTVQADVFTKDDKPITCLTATVNFTFGGRSESEAEELR